MNAKPLLLSMIGLQTIWVLAVWLARGMGGRQSFGALTAVLALGAAALWLPMRTHLPMFTNRLRLHPGRALGVLCSVFCAAVAYGIYQDQLPDEPRMLAAARVMASGGLGPLFESYDSFGRLGRLNPPLMPITFGVAMRAVGDDPSWLRPIPAAFLVLTLVVVYRLGQELYDQTVGALAVTLFLALPYTWRYGTALLNDIGVVFFFSLTVLLTIRLSTRALFRTCAATGVAIGLGTLTKYTMVLVCPVLMLYPLLIGRFRPAIRALAVVAAIALVVILPWAIYGYISGIAGRQAQRIMDLSRVMTYGLEARSMMVGLVVKNLPSGIGLYNLPLLAVGIWGATRNRRPSDLFLLFWITVVWSVLLGTLPDPRYFMITFPALAILMARALGATAQAAPRVAGLALGYLVTTLYVYTAAPRFTP